MLNIPVLSPRVLRAFDGQLTRLLLLARSSWPAVLLGQWHLALVSSLHAGRS